MGAGKGTLPEYPLLVPRPLPSWALGSCRVSTTLLPAGLSDPCPSARPLSPPRRRVLADQRSTLHSNLELGNIPTDGGIYPHAVPLTFAERQTLYVLDIFGNHHRGAVSRMFNLLDKQYSVI